MARALLGMAVAADDNDAASFVQPQELTTSTLGDDEAIIDGEVVDDAVASDAQNQGLRGQPVHIGRSRTWLRRRLSAFPEPGRAARGRRSARRSVAALNLPSPWTQTGHTWCHVPLTHVTAFCSTRTFGAVMTALTTKERRRRQLNNGDGPSPCIPNGLTT